MVFKIDPNLSNLLKIALVLRKINPNFPKISEKPEIFSGPTGRQTASM